MALSEYNNTNATDLGDMVGLLAGERLAVTRYGAKPDGVIVFDGAINDTETTFVSASASFTSADIGKTIWIKDAGAEGSSYTLTKTQTATTARDLLTTITAVNSPTSVEVADAASATVSNIEARWGTDSTANIQLAFDEAVNKGFRLYFPRGHYLTTGPLKLRSGLNIKGDGWAYKNWQDKTPSVVMCCSDTNVLEFLEADIGSGAGGEDEEGWENGALSEITLRGTDRPGSRGLYSFKTLGLGLFDCGFTRFGESAVKLDPAGIFGIRMRNCFANECLLVDDREDYIGIFDLGPSDMFVSDCEAVGNIDPVWETDLFGGGFIVGFAIRGNNSWYRDCMGALCQIGFYVGPTTTPQVVTTLVNCRADQNQGHGYVIDSWNCNFVACRSHANGLGADGTYNGFNVIGGSHQFTACQATQLNDGSEPTIPHENRLLHCFNFDLAIGPTFFPPSKLTMCQVGNAFSGDPTQGFTGEAFHAEGDTRPPLVITTEFNTAANAYDFIHSAPLNNKQKHIYFEAPPDDPEDPSPDTTVWSLGAGVPGADNAFALVAWDDAREVPQLPIAVFRNAETGEVSFISLRDAGFLSIDPSIGFVLIDSFTVLKQGIVLERSASYTGERRYFIGPNSDAGTSGTGQLIMTLSSDDGSTQEVFLRVKRTGTNVDFLQLLENSGYIDLRGDLQLYSGKIIQLQTTGAKLLAGTGDPNGSVAAVGGSLYLEGATGRLWVKEGGVGTTGWVMHTGPQLPDPSGNENKVLKVVSGVWDAAKVDLSQSQTVQIGSASSGQFLTCNASNAVTGIAPATAAAQIKPHLGLLMTDILGLLDAFENVQDNFESALADLAAIVATKADASHSHSFSGDTGDAGDPSHSHSFSGSTS